MALPKKGLRHITVNDVIYNYKISGQDEGIHFVITQAKPNEGQLLEGYISYHSNLITNFDSEGIATSWSGLQRTKVTPHTIRQVILYALENDWHPHENLKPLLINDWYEKIDLQLKEITLFPELTDIETVAVFLSNSYLKRRELKTDFTTYNGEGNIYHTFADTESAKNFAQQKIKENDELSCWLMKDVNKAFMFIDKQGITQC